jgi:hydroxyacylglutathione hydrolase
MAFLEETDGMRLERLSLGPYGANTYILTCRETSESVVVDAPGDAEKVIEALSGTRPQYLLMTHNHIDHVGALAQLKKELGVRVGADVAEVPGLPVTPDILLKHNDVVSFGRIHLKVLSTPGHTPGSLCFYAAPFLISGDTLFPGGPGKTWSSAGFTRIIASLTENIFTLPDITRVFPGHGEPTTVGRAKEEFAVFSSNPHDPDLYGDVSWLSS